MTGQNPDLIGQIKRLEHQCGVVLYLSSLNLFLNCTMLVVSFLISLS